MGYGFVCYDWLGCGGSEKPEPCPWLPRKLLSILNQSLKRFLFETSPIFLCFSEIVSELTYAFNIESNEIIVPDEDDWYAYAFDELLKDLIAVWQDLKWPGPYVVTWNAVATALTFGFRHSLPDSADVVP